MGLFNFFKKKEDKNKQLNEFVDKATKDAFPGGAKDIEAGTEVLLLILENKIDHNTAVRIFCRSAALAKITKEFSRERLKQHLAGYCLQYFNEAQIDSYYDFLSAYSQTNPPIQYYNSAKNTETQDNDTDQNYTIFWQQYSPDSQVGQYWKATDNFALPYFAIKNKKDAPEKQVLFGILIGYNDNPPTVNMEYTKSLFPKILQHQQRGFGYDSLEKLILDVAANLRENVDDLLSYKVLSNGIEIDPNSSKIKFDCCATVYNLIERGEFSKEKGIEILEKLVYEIDEREIKPETIPFLNKLKQYAPKQQEEENNVSLFIDENGEPSYIISESNTQTC